MNTKVVIEVEARHESTLRRALALIEELEQLALTAPDGAVFADCEDAVIHQGRDLQRLMLADAVARRIDAAEKKGRRSVPVPADARGTAAGPNAAT
jgi:hypothetical protein